MVWDVRNQAGVIVLPGHYQARVKIGVAVLTESFNVLIDPRVAADGVTLADLQEQFEHNMRMRELVTGVNQLVARVREAQTKARAPMGVEADKTAALNAIAARLITAPVRYSKPGLQAQITYLASMTANVDQKIGRDAIERYAVLKKEYDVIQAEVERVIGVVAIGQ
jgi:Fe-S cluster assembly scaffold protein SufB